MVSQNAIGHIYQLSPKKEAIDLNVVHLLMTDEAAYRNGHINLRNPQVYF